MQQLPAAAATATQAQLLSPTGQLQAVHQPAPAVQTQQALQQDPNDPNKWHVVQVATAAAQPAQAAPIATAQLVTAAPAVSMAASVVAAAAAADDSIAAASSTTDVKPSHGTGKHFCLSC